jgi:hypothetical protein
MPTIINADTATGGAIITGDTSGQLQLQSGGVTALTTNGANVTVAGTFTATGGVTGVNLATGVTGILPVANGGTGATTLTANNVLLGNGTSAVQAVAPGASGNVLTSNGTTWASAAAVSGVQQFTSSGSITAGAAVSLNSDGTVSTVTGVNNPEAALAQDVVDSNDAQANCLGTFYDPNNDWTIFAKRFPFQSVFNVSAFRINSAGNVSVFGSNSINYPEPTTTNNMPVRIIRTGTNRYAVMYASTTGAQYMGLFTINASTGAVTNIGAASFGGYNSTVSYDMDYEPVSDRIIAVTKNSASNVTVEAVNPANGTKTANAQFSNTPGAGDTIAVACHTTSGQFFLAFCDVFTNGCYFRTATINSAGTAITFVSSPVYAVNTGQMAAMAYAPSVDRYIFIARPSSGQLSFVMFNTSGSSVNSGAITFTSGNASTNPQKSMVNDTLQLVQTITSTDSGSSSALQYGQVAYTASAFGTQSLSGGFPSAALMQRGSFSPTGTTGIYTYTAPDYAGSDTSTRAVTFRPFLFSSNAQNFVGFATNTVTTGQTAIVAVPGGVATNRTGLTRNLEYYLNFDGSLVTTPTPFGVVLRATSATGGEVIRPVSAKRPVSLVSLSSTTSAIIPLGATGFRAIECYYSLSLSSSNNPTVRFTTTSGSTPTLSGTGFWSTGSTNISTGSWSTLSPVSASSFTGFFSVDSSVVGGVNQGNYGGVGWTANSNSLGAPATQITFSFPVTASGSVMVYGIPA